MPKYKVTVHETRAYMGTVEAPNRAAAYPAAVKAAKDGKLNKLPGVAGTWAVPSVSEIEGK